MTPSAPVGFRFCPGTQTASAETVHTTPLGYDRADIPVGAPLPLPPSAELLDRLSRCEEVEVAFHGKLGDTLLALSAVRALADWLALRAPNIPVAVRTAGPYAELIRRSGLVTQEPLAAVGSKRAVIGDRAAIQARTSDAEISVVCDPAMPPCWSSNGHLHPDLPARYYLALERRLGFRLPAAAPYAPLLATGPSPRVEQLRSLGWFDGLTIAAITATSWPGRKDYTAQRFTQLARKIAEAQGTQVQLLHIGGHNETDLDTPATDTVRHVQTLRLDSVPADHLADVFPHCDLVVGNDTGLTHLAAMTRRSDGGGPPVVGLYARHSHSKWRTGWAHHHAVATDFSDRMHQGDLCPVRDGLAPSPDRQLNAITPTSLADICTELLNGGKR